jgi:hypothetical protein
VSFSSIRPENCKALAMRIAADFDPVTQSRTGGGFLTHDPEILDSIDSIYFVRCSSKKEEKGEKRQSRNHNAEAHSENDHHVKWGSVGH